jgi:hypothetical protein
MKGNIELIGFVLLIIGTLGLLANEFIFAWGSSATVAFAAANVVGFVLLAFAHWGMKQDT